MICVSIAHISFEELIKSITEFEMLELRLDLLDFTDEQYQQIIATKKLIIATFRYGNTPDDKRSESLKKLIEFGVSHVDIELDAEPEFVKTMVDFAKKNNCKTILSYHDFKATPNLIKLESLIQEAKGLKADYTKIVTLAKSSNDVARTMSLYENNERLIAFNMGETGKISRVASLFLGADFTYASLSNEQTTADGQLTYLELKTLQQLIS